MGQRPQVDSIVPFEEVKARIHAIGTRGRMGKVLVRVAG